ncbi:MAG: lipopolysaccharide biosynthesis protein [Chloroflexi bacterium]|nr:lipopolysaccharide biosynthesis protein [Chloroflexota bacterium]
MRLSEYIRIIRRRIWVIVLAVMVTAVAAYVFSKLQEPLYRSEASYLVVPNRNDNGLSIVLTNNMNSYKQLALARPQIEKISAQLQLDRSPEWLLEHISIQANADDRKMIVQVDYPDIDMAPRLANAVGENMAALVSSLNDGLEGTDKINMRITTPATPPQLYRPQTRINVLAGAFLGLVVGLLLAFVLNAIDDTLKNTEDVERHVGLTILGAIPASNTTSERRTNARKPA